MRAGRRGRTFCGSGCRAAGLRLRRRYTICREERAVLGPRGGRSSLCWAVGSCLVGYQQLDSNNHTPGSAVQFFRRQGGTSMARCSLPNRSLLELALFIEVRDAVCFPQRNSIPAGECEVEFSPCVRDERIGCCLRRDV